MVVAPDALKTDAKNKRILVINVVNRAGSAIVIRIALRVRIPFFQNLMDSVC
jgi:hypothetical protein